MTLVETIMVALLASSPFGNTPFVVSELTQETVEIEVADRVLVVNKDMEVLSVDGIDQEHEQCGEEIDI